MKSKKQKKAVVGYVRTAAIPQVKVDISVDAQEEQIKKYCKAKGYEVTKVFSDNGRSGANLERPGIQALLAEAVAGRIAKVICLDFSRLSRNTMDFLVLKSLLKKNGVEIVDVTGANISEDNFSGVMDEMLAVIESFHSRISECRKSRSHKGK